MSHETVKNAPQCRICHSRYTAFVREVPLRRMHGSVPAFYCMDCGSFFHPQVYQEDDSQLQRDAEWHLTVEERNRRWATNFINGVKGMRPEFNSLIEIGCGTGTLLSVAKEHGWTVRGYDTNRYTVELAQKEHGIEIESYLWNSESVRERMDLVVCISTFEHLEEPHLLMREIADYCKKHAAEAFISVPFLTERENWSVLDEETPETIQNPFYLCDVHINHFTHEGFRRFARLHGATSVVFTPVGWIGYWLSFTS